MLTVYLTKPDQDILEIDQILWEMDQVIKESDREFWRKP